MQLIDKDFLQKLYKRKNIKSYMKIYLLNFDETPKEVIEGKTSTCNINLDGNSAIRRTCSIGITGVKDMEIHKTWWGINSKIKVEIGIINELDDTYPEVIWLPLGTYLIDNFSSSLLGKAQPSRINFRKTAFTKPFIPPLPSLDNSSTALSVTA